VPEALVERRALEEGLGRDAPAVEARAAELVLVDERGLEAKLRATKGGRVAASAGAEDESRGYRDARS